MKAELYHWIDEEKKVMSARTRRLRRDDRQKSLSETYTKTVR